MCVQEAHCFKVTRHHQLLKLVPRPGNQDRVGMSDTVQQGWKLLTMVPLWYPYPCLPLFDDRIHISSDKISIQK